MYIRWSAKPQKGKTQRDPSVLQTRVRCFQAGRQHGSLAGRQIQPSPKEEDGLGGMTKVGGSYGSRLKMLRTVRFGGTPQQLSLLPLLST